MPQPITEVLPGVHHWTVPHERIKIEVSSYYLEPERVLLDPMVPPEGLDWFAEHGEPEHVLLTNRHHYRHSGRFVAAFGCDVRAPRPGMHEFTAGEPVEPYDPGERLPGGMAAHEVGAICPDDFALEIARADALALADAVVRMTPGDPPGFVPDELLSDDPEADKAGMRAALGRLVEELSFDNLLLAHGPPVIGGGHEALRAIAAGELG